MKHGVTNAVNQELEPTSIDSAMAWFNATGGLTMHFYIVMCSAILWLTATRKFQVNAVALLIAFVTITFWGLSMTESPARFDVAAMRFGPE
jgi:hypothetical protein